MKKGRYTYDSAIKNGILPLATTLMDLEGTILREISQGKTNTVYVESKYRTNEQRVPDREQTDGSGGWEKR